MQKLLIIAMVAVLILSFAVSALAEKPTRKNCEYVQECDEFHCIVWLCCIVPGEGEICVLVT